MNLYKVVFLLICVGEAFGWLDMLRTFPLTKRSHKKNGTPNGKHNNQISGCRKDRHCKPDQFCHRYERACMACKTEGQMCRRNKMCCRGMECASGKCRRRIQLGRRGALCTKDRDCNYGFCCARQNGQSVCKPMLDEGMACGIPEGGRHYFWNHQCPCAYGLKCKQVDPKVAANKKLLSIAQDWKNENRRCIRPKGA